MNVIPFLGFLTFLLPAAVFAKGPILASDIAGIFPEVTEGQLVEKSVVIEEKASAFDITYSSDAPIELRVSFPFGTESGMSYNPLRTLQWKDVPAGDHQTITLDLTRSPAWSPKQDFFFLHVVAPPGTVISIHDIDHISPRIVETIMAAFAQLSVNEPVIFSSVNTLEGYRALGVSVSMILGLMLIVMLLVLGIKYQVLGIKLSSFHAHPTVLMVSLIFLLLYDARFSFDLLQTSARDLTEWTQKGEYRQLGPIHHIADLLKNDSTKSMKVSVCSRLDDIYFKQLRYHLYPVPVRHSKDLWEDATHVVFIDTPRELHDDGTIVCSEGQTPRRVTLLQTFDEGTKVYLFQP